MISLILLIIAYTVGIGTVILTRITMKRGYSTREQFLFMLSFFLLILFITLYQTLGTPFDTLSILAVIAVAVTLPRAIWSFRGTAKKAGTGTVLLLAPIPILSLFLIQGPAREYAAYLHLSGSIIYSMVIMNRNRSSSLALSSKVLRKGIPLVTLTALPVILLVDVFGLIAPGAGFHTLPIFYTLLNLLFFRDSLKQLTAGRRVNAEEIVAALPLSEREQEVTLLLLEGLPYSTIGSRLSIAPSTVKTHCSNIYGKLNISNRYQLFGFIMSRN